MPEFDHVKDSGERQEFETGSRRDTQKGKGRFDLLPWLIMRRFARHYENGAEKYGDNNYLKGQPTSRYISSAVSHIVSYMVGRRDEDHLIAAMWNIAAAAQNEELVELGIYDPKLHDVFNFEDRESFMRGVFGDEDGFVHKFGTIEYHEK